MMNNTKPVLSSDFTLNDIRTLRNYNSLRHKDMTTEELNKELKVNVDKFNKQINEIKQKKRMNVQK